MRALIERVFSVTTSGSTIKRELLGGLTTFMTMAYIIFVQPAILSQCGMDFDAVMVATCIASACACFIMAFLANYPIALAPAMGHNVYFAFIACPLIKAGIDATTDVAPWQIALGAICISGVIFLLLSVFGFRKQIIKAVPPSLRNAIAAGIGLMIALIGFEWAGLTRAHPVTYVTLGAFNNPAVITSVTGIITIAALMVLRVPGAILIGIVLTACTGLIGGVVRFEGFMSPVPSLEPTLMKLSFKGMLSFGFFELIFVFFFLDLFDTVGTLIGVGERAGFIKNNELPRAREALLSDASATVIGSLLGTSTVTSYIESAAGVSCGARTGLSNIVTGLLMLAALFFKPVIAMIGSGYETSDGVLLYPVIAPALIIVGCMMMRCVIKIDWDEPSEAVPSFLTITAMPFCGFSITDGISFGFISYVLLKIVSRKTKEIHPLLAVFAALFILRYIFFL